MNRFLYRILSGRFGACLELQILMRRTARVFGAAVPKRTEFSAQKLLSTYAQFTADLSLRVIQSGCDPEPLRRKLFHMACDLGSGLRWWLRPEDERECLAIITILYRNIGIQICEEAPGIFCIHKCYFSDFYTPEICSVISAIDQGIFAGIYGGGKLTFRERITEGKEVCRTGLR